MIGKTLGKYRIQDRIGRGGMGTVYLAVDETLRRDVAIKVLNSELNDAEVAKRFKAEAMTVARLNHPGIATVYELFEHDSQWLMVMEFVRGETLEHLIERSGGLPVERAGELMTQALSALAHAHSMGVVHRDLKPANLMLTDTGLVKIMDFGIARVSGSEHLTSAGFMMGTPAYMAPEQVLGHEIDARADLYAMGVVLYRLTTGKLPFKGETPFAMAQSQVNDPPTPVRMMREGLPPWIEAVIARALMKPLEDRFQSADEFRETIRRGLAGLPLETGRNQFVPPDLLATAVPGSMPVLTPAKGVPASGMSGPADMPTVMGSSGSMPTVMSSSVPALAGGSTGQSALPASTGQAAIPVSTTGPTAVAAVQPAKRKSNTIVLVAVAAIVLLAIAGGLWLRARSNARAAEAAAAAATATPPAADQPAAAPATTDPAAAGAAGATVPPPAITAPQPATPTAPPPALATNDPARAGQPPATPGAPGAARGAQPAATAPLPATAAPVPDASDPLVAYKDIKFLTYDDKNKGQEQDAVVNFVAGHLSVSPKNGGAALAQVAYRDVMHATYIKAKDPKWDPGLASPPTGTEFPHGFMGGSRHWLVIQSKTTCVVLRLSDDNVSTVLGTVEGRMALKVDRPDAGGK